MVIYGVYIVSKSGGLIFNNDHYVPKVETECIFNEHPIDLKLVVENKKVVVAFGHRDGVASKAIGNIFYINLTNYFSANVYYRNTERIQQYLIGIPIDMKNLMANSALKMSKHEK